MGDIVRQTECTWRAWGRGVWGGKLHKDKRLSIHVPVPRSKATCCLVQMTYGRSLSCKIMVKNPDTWAEQFLVTVMLLTREGDAIQSGPLLVKVTWPKLPGWDYKSFLEIYTEKTFVAVHWHVLKSGVLSEIWCNSQNLTLVKILVVKHYYLDQWLRLQWLRLHTCERHAKKQR